MRATELGLRALAITDRNSLAGVVRAWSALETLREEASEALKIRSGSQVDTCSRQEIASQSLPHPVLGALPKLITGARIVLRDCPVEWLALPMDKPAYHRLSQLLTLASVARTRAIACWIWLI